MKKLSKVQRLRLIERSGLADTLRALSDEEVLAAHDLMHDIMEERHGTNVRHEAEQVMDNG